MGLMDRLAKLGNGLMEAARDVAESLNRTTKEVVEKREVIASKTKAVVENVGVTIQAAGAAVGSFSAGMSAAVRQRENASTTSTNPVVVEALDLIAKGARQVGEGTATLGNGVTRTAECFGETVGGVVIGGVSTVSEAADAVAISDDEIESSRQDVMSLGEQLRRRSEVVATAFQRASSRNAQRERLDRVVVGGITLSAAINTPSSVPADVEQAFAAAYPGLAITESFGEAAARMSPEELAGLVSGVKGKLFELQFVDYLNSGALPDGYLASTAPSATQAGWDIRITDDQGQVAEVLQAKATESVGYVREALERYPGIDVTTTSEVYAQLSAIGAAEGVRDSGISEATLEQIVSSAAGDGAGLDAADLLPSVVGLAVIGLSIFLDPSISPQDRARAFGERGARAGTASLAGYGALLLTQTWWLALAGGVGMHWLAGKGRMQRQQLEYLKRTLETLRGMQQPIPALARRG
jgi:hypothetical protein